MATEPNPPPNGQRRRGTWLQRLWWTARALYHQLKPCRFSFIVALIAWPVFLCVAQGTEILRTVGEGMATTGQWYWPRVSFFFIALILWSVCSWYTARVLLNVDFRRNDEPTAAPSPRTQRHVPRLLGIAPVVIVGCGFMVASRSYEAAEPTRGWLVGFAVFCAVLAAVFYLLLVLRRYLIGEMPARRARGMSDFKWGTWLGVGVMVLLSLALFVAFTVAPVKFAQNIGMGTILLLAAASWVTLGSVLVYFGGRWQFPVITVLVLLTVLFSLWNDNHSIRIAPPQTVKRLDVIGSFQAWYAMAEKNHPTAPQHPLYIVATEGGGIRAAYWTAIVLGAIQDANPNFAPHLFAISGVSGGSLGAAVFDALLAESAPGSFKDKAHQILGQDFLSPTLAAMLYPDLVQRILPVPIACFDRGRALEMGWEKAWRDTMGNDRFARSFVDLWHPGPREWMPSLFLNGTSVEKGNRIITSNLRLTNIFLDADDAASVLANHKLGATEAACHIPLSTAAHMSARFTYVSPAGRFPDGSHVVDGGYFENSASTTALEIATRIKDYCAYQKIADKVDVKVIMISNDPRKPSLMIGPAKPGPDPSIPGRTKPETVAGFFLGEVTAPIYALMNTRNARGTYAQKAIGREQRRFKVGMIQAPEDTPSPTLVIKDIVYFKLRDTQVPLPLGWMLSAAAAKTMRDQLELDDDVVQNKSALSEVLKSLPPAQP